MLNLLWGLVLLGILLLGLSVSLRIGRSDVRVLIFYLAVLVSAFLTTGFLWFTGVAEINFKVLTIVSIGISVIGTLMSLAIAWQRRRRHMY